MDNNQFAIPNNSSMDDIEDEEEDDISGIDSWKIKVMNCDTNEKVALITTELEWNLGEAKIYYSDKFKGFYLSSKEIGLAVVSMEGRLLFHKPDVCNLSYDNELDLFFYWEGKNISIFRLEDIDK